MLVGRGIPAEPSGGYPSVSRVFLRARLLDWKMRRAFRSKWRRRFCRISRLPALTRIHIQRFTPRADISGKLIASFLIPLGRTPKCAPRPTRAPQTTGAILALPDRGDFSWQFTQLYFPCYPIAYPGATAGGKGPLCFRRGSLNPFSLGVPILSLSLYSQCLTFNLTII